MMLDTLRKLGILPRAPTRSARHSRTPAGSAPIERAQFTNTPMLMEELEPRILHSADLSPLVGAEDSLAPLSEHQWLEPETVRVEPVSLAEQQAPALELVFVDTTTPDYQTLLDDLTSTNGAQRNFEVVLLDGERDGVAQITDVLAERSDVNAVHIVSHGTEGSVQLGGSWLTHQSLDAYAEDITGWGRALTDEADLLLYGCDLAGSADGRNLVERLSALTGADVAASDDLTGHKSLGGDWDLEYSAGDIEADVAFSANAQQNWTKVLAWFDANTGAPVAGSSNADDLFVGDAGDNNSTDAGPGNDVLYGDDGDDDLTGGNDNDLLLGGTGDDTLKGGNQDDILNGGPGDDYLEGNNHADVLIGGGGNDTLHGDNHNDLFLFSGAQNGDVYTVDGGNHTDTIDLSEFGSGNVTIGAGTITVDLGGGQFFTINHVNVENIVLAESAGNHAAQADAGVDQAVVLSSLVTLDASASSDPDLDMLTYDWQQIEGTWVTLSDPTAASPTFTAPASSGVLKFAVTVSDGLTRDVDIVAVNVDIGGFNDAPVVGAPVAALNATEQTALAIHGTGFTVSDADEAGGGASATLSVGEGNITVVEGNSGVVITGGNGSNSVTVTGSIAEIDNLLTGTGTGTITYLNSADAPGAATTFTVTVNDQGNTGTDPGLTGDATSEEGSNSVIINVAAVNDAPGVSAPASITVTEDVASTISGISFADVDAATGDFVATFSVVRGTLAATSSGGVMVGGSTKNLTLTGSVANINSFISASNLTYNTAANDTSAETLDVSINDCGNTGSGGSLSSPVSSITLDVTPVNDAPTGSVSIIGTPTEDEVLSADASSVGDDDGLGTFNYQWFKDSLNISGATASTYTLTDADVGAAIKVVVSYTDGHGSSQNVTSATTDPVANINDAPTGKVRIDKTTPAEGDVLSASNTLEDADGIGAISYQWKRGGVDIYGATGATYTTAQVDAGATITVVARYTDGHGTFENVTSASTSPVANINDAPSGSVNITGTLAADEVLSADTSGVDDEDGLGTFSYQWFRDGLNIPGATASTYTLAGTDAGSTISVQISYTDTYGTPETLSSSGVGPIANATAPQPTVIVVDTGTPGPGNPQVDPEPQPDERAPELVGPGSPAAESGKTAAAAAPAPAGSGGVVPLDTVLGNTQSNDTTALPLRETANAQPTRATRITAAETSFDFRSFALQEFDTALNNVAFVVTPTMPLPSFGAGLQGVTASDFVDELDNLRDSLQEQARYAGLLATSNFTLTAGASIVYLAWLLRAEVLLGSFLSSLPAWRLVDPLPVLGQLAAEDGEEDDDSLESLVERKNRTAHAADMQDIELA